MTEPYGEIYVVTCSVNGKRYVGQTTCGADGRWKTHLGNAKGRRGFLLAQAIRKHGVENFSMKMVDVASTQEELDAKETFLIARLKTRVPNGYNLKEGGSRGKHSPETIMKMKGIKLSEETKAKISFALRGKKRTPEAIAKTSEKIRGRKRSDEVRAKISAAKKGQTLSPEALARRNASIRAYHASHSEEVRVRNQAIHLGVKRSDIRSFKEGWVRRRARAEELGLPLVSEIQREKLRANYKRATPESLERLREAMASPEVRAKISMAAKARSSRGPHTKETKAKMRAAKLGKPRSEEAKAAMKAGHARRKALLYGNQPNVNQL